jgi:hypothetical protein
VNRRNAARFTAEEIRRFFLAVRRAERRRRA